MNEYEESWDKFEDTYRNLMYLKNELQDNSPETFRKLTEHLNNILEDLEDMIDYYSL